MPFGYGKHREANGNIYEGCWYFGAKHGQGKYTDKFKDQVIVGVWDSAGEICKGN